jgi:hypothetical protein
MDLGMYSRSFLGNSILRDSRAFEGFGGKGEGEGE